MLQYRCVNCRPGDGRRECLGLVCVVAYLPSTYQARYLFKYEEERAIRVPRETKNTSRNIGERPPVAAGPAIHLQQNAHVRPSLFLKGIYCLNIGFFVLCATEGSAAQPVSLK